jgi:hypothetical protein
MKKEGLIETIMGLGTEEANIWPTKTYWRGERRDCVLNVVGLMGHFINAPSSSYDLFWSMKKFK